MASIDQVSDQAEDDVALAQAMRQATTLRNSIRFLAEGAEAMALEREESITPAAPVAGGPATPTVDNDVQFTVYRPKAVVPKEWYTLLAFAHIAELPRDADAGTPDPIQEVARQASNALGADAAAYRDTTAEAGKKYEYAVTAVDSAMNESGKSKAETVMTIK